MRKSCGMLSLLLLFVVTLAAHGETFTYDLVSGSNTFVFTEPAILTVDTVIPLASITTNDPFLSIFEIDPVSPGNVSWTETNGKIEMSFSADFTGALTTTGTFISTSLPDTTLTISATAVPEQSSLMLLGTGAIGLFSLGIRRARTWQRKG